MTSGPPDPLYTVASGHQRDHRAISRVLADVAGDWPHERITLGDIVAALADRGYGILMLMLALPTTLPVAPPGLSAAFGLPLAAIAIQLALGSERPWLPRAVLRRSILASDFRRMIERGTPLLEKLERVVRPRLPVLTGWAQERVVGLACTILGVLLASPIPFTNIPLSFAIVFLSLGLLARDGLALIAGAAIAVAAIVFLFYMTAASWNVIESLAARLF